MGTVKDGVRALTFPGGKNRNPLGTPSAKSAISAGKGSSKSAATNNGIASPLTEQTKTADGKTVPDREYYSERTLTTSDGLFTFKVKAIKKQKFKDAKMAEVIIDYADPINE